MAMPPQALTTVGYPPPRSSGRKSRGKAATVTLRWDAYSTGISKAFLPLFQQGKLLDITLACERKLIKAHRVILAACSPYFEEMICSCSPDKELVIFIAGMSYWELWNLVMFMYTGEMVVPRERLDTIIQAANDLQIRGLEKVNPYSVDKTFNSSFMESPSAPPPTPTRVTPGKDQHFQPIPLPRKYTNVNGGQTLAIIKQELPDSDEQGQDKGTSVPSTDQENQHQQEEQEKEPENNQVESESDVQVGPLELVKVKHEFKDLDEEEGTITNTITKEGYAELTRIPNPEYTGELTLTDVKMEAMDVSEKATQVLSGAVTEPIRDEDEEEEDDGDIGNTTFNDDDYSDHNVKRIRSRRTKYPPQLRNQSVYDLVTLGMPLANVADKYCVPKKTLSNWKSKYLKEINKKNQELTQPQDLRKRNSTPQPQRRRTRGRSPRPSSSSTHQGCPLPPVEGSTRDERLRNASKLVVDGLTNVRGAAAHYSIPRTTLSNFMRRNGLMKIRRGDASPEARGDNTFDELPDLTDSMYGEAPNNPDDEADEMEEDEDNE